MFLNLKCLISIVLFGNGEKLNLSFGILEEAWVILNGMKYKILKESMVNQGNKAVFINVQDTGVHPMLGYSSKNGQTFYKQGTTSKNIENTHPQLGFKLLSEANGKSYLECVGMQNMNKFPDKLKIVNLSKLEGKNPNIHQLLSIEQALNQKNEDIVIHVPVKYIDRNFLDSYKNDLEIAFPEFEFWFDKNDEDNSIDYILMKAPISYFENWVYLNSSLFNDELIKNLTAFDCLKNSQVVEEIIDNGAVTLVEFKEVKGEYRSNLALSPKLVKKVQENLIENKEIYLPAIYEEMQDHCENSIKDYKSLSISSLLQNE